MKNALQTNLNFIRIDELTLDQGGAIVNKNNPESYLGSKYMIGSIILSVEMRKVIPTLILIKKRNWPYPQILRYQHFEIHFPLIKLNTCIASELLKGSSSFYGPHMLVTFTWLTRLFIQLEFLKDLEFARHCIRYRECEFTWHISFQISFLQLFSYFL